MEYTAAESQPSNPGTLPLPVPQDLTAFGFVILSALWILQIFLKQHQKQSYASWEMLDELVEGLQTTNKMLVETNQELVNRMARIHERLEQLETMIDDQKKARS